MPAQGAVIREPLETYAITFSHPYDPATVEAADLTVNGLEADWVTFASPTTVVFTFTSSPVQLPGQQHLAIADSAIARLSDRQGSAAFASGFLYAPPILVNSAWITPYQATGSSRCARRSSRPTPAARPIWVTLAAGRT